MRGAEFSRYDNRSDMAGTAVMRVFLVTGEFARGPGFDGGLGQALLRIALGLERMGHDVTVLRPGKTRDLYQDSGINVITVEVPAPLWTRWLNTLTLRQFDLCRTLLLRIRALSKEVERISLKAPPDIIQYPNLGGLGVCRPSGIPSVIRLSADTISSRKAGGFDNQNRFAMLQLEFLEARAIKSGPRCFSKHGTSIDHYWMTGLVRSRFSFSSGDSTASKGFSSSPKFSKNSSSGPPDTGWSSSEENMRASTEHR